ncbi:MAG: phospholipase A [Candidatus Azobacteroides sp.]|nr:phospholipase A [Candidatus Azobacteroides sp.]
MIKRTGTGFLFLVFFFCSLSWVQSQELFLGDSLYNEINGHGEQIPYYKRHQIEIKEADVIRATDKLPAFGIFRDNFIVTGISLNHPIKRNTADALFQISIRHRATKSHLPFNSFLFITYTQKSFWNIYEESMPFYDTNYNPGIGVGKYLIHNNILRGAAFIQIEHESNGRDELDSRSWNMISFSSKYFFNPYINFGLRAWIPIVDGGNNRNLVSYKGLGTISIDCMTTDRKWWITGELNPRKGWGNINTMVTAGFKASRNSNQYFYARFYNGKGDCLLDYDKYKINIQFGLCIKGEFGSIF